MTVSDTDSNLGKVACALAQDMRAAYACDSRFEAARLLASANQSVETLLHSLPRSIDLETRAVRNSLQALALTLTGHVEGLQDSVLSRSMMKRTLASAWDQYIVHVKRALPNEEPSRTTSAAPAPRAKPMMVSLGGLSWQEALQVIQEHSDNLSGLQQQLNAQRGKKSTANTPASTISGKTIVIDYSGDKTTTIPPESVTPKDAEDLEESDGTLRKFAAHRNKLPVKMRGAPFQLVRLPVLPIFDSYQVSDTANLRRYGIRAALVEGYAVLLDQLILLVDIGPQSMLRDVVATPTSNDALNAATAFLRTHNRRNQSAALAMVAENGIVNPRAKNIMCYWLLPEARMTKFANEFGGRGGGVRDWGFPF